MKIKETNIKGSYPEYLGCLLFGIIMSIVMTILSIQAYYTRDITFGFVVVFGVMAYLWTIICIVMGIREIIVVRNNSIIEYVIQTQEQDYIKISRIICKLTLDIEKLKKEVKQCKKKSC